MWVPDKNKTGGFSIKDINDNELKKYNTNKIFSIVSSCEKLDKILKIKKKIAVKIDVERHEEKLIKGGIDLLTKNNVILQIKIFPDKKKQIQQLLNNLKYKLISK